jgi:fibronectin type 3 domain-containing protein
VTCVTPVDTFPPAAPTSLRAVAGEHVVSLIWDANREADLAGYLVLRSELPDGALVPLTPEPITDTTFNDTTVKSGVRYAYVVVAVDTSKNRSAPSNRVEEAGR